MKKITVKPLSLEERHLLSVPFELALSNLTRFEKLFWMCKAGISQLAARPDLIRALKKWSTEPEAEHEKRLAEAEELAEASRREQKENFPMLYAQAIVTLSNFLDTTMEDFFILWFQHRKDVLSHKAVRAVQVRAADYELLEPNDRMRVIVQEIMSKSIGEKEKQGVERFEIMLRLIGVQQGCHRKILVPLKELRAFRNAIVHAGQRADKKFREACPWLAPEDGKLMITEQFYRKTSHAVVDYFASVLSRIQKAFFPDSEQDTDGGTDRNDTAEMKQNKT